MLTREVMGVVALGVLWVNTLLIAAAAWKQLAALLARRARLRPLGAGETGHGLVRGAVARGDGPDGTFAHHRVKQIGHSAATSPDRRAILFHDSAYDGAIHGGAVTVGGVEIPVAPCAARAEVWLPPAVVARAAGSGSDAELDAAFDASKKAKGYARTVEASIARGDEVWIVGDVVDDAGARRLVPSREHGLLVATFDPRALCAKKALLCAAALVGILGGAALVTFLALVPPAFGTTSIVGGVLGLAFFLLVQPAGTALRDAVRLPHLAFVRGEWVRDVRGEKRAEVSSAPTATASSPAGE